MWQLPLLCAGRSLDSAFASLQRRRPFSQSSLETHPCQHRPHRHPPASPGAGCWKWPFCSTLRYKSLLWKMAWFFFFFFLGMSGQLWGASYIQHPAPVRGAGQGANQWASSPPHPPGCSDLFSPFLKVARFHRGSQLPLSSVAFVNFCRPARLHCLRDFMFDF